MSLRKIASRPFVIALVILVSAAAGLDIVMASIKGFLIKKPIALRQPLFEISETFGSYRVFKKEPRMKPEIEKELGTTNYISWYYRDTSKAERDPGAFIQFHVAYYTGSVDVVPHVPERCIVAGGATTAGETNVVEKLNNPLAVPDKDGEGVRVPAGLGQLVRLPGLDVPIHATRFIPLDPKQSPFVVTYLFVANGQLMSRAEEVRLQAFDITDEYAFFCKVQVFPLGVSDVEEATRITADFLSYALPEVMVCLPDWDDVRAGRYPVTSE